MELKEIILDIQQNGVNGDGLKYLIKVSEKFPKFDFSALNWKKEDEKNRTN